ncbi:MAG TPA: M57 family metalloprotease [Anaerolineales bacterium]|nr:M57 family metalloprotease [Anaerolineales bacterium]
MRMKRMFVVVLVLAALLLPTSVQAKPADTLLQRQTGPTCKLPESDAEALVILSNYYPNRYWWDHTDLTVAVQAHPSATEEQLEAIDDAIDTWSEVLEKCFDGLITLTNVTDTGNNAQQEADIVLHYVPTAGGAVFAGYAICGAQGCPNILVRTDLPPSWGVDPYSPEYFYWVTLHELGHALGLGHATNLRESTDLMGYGWIGTTDAVLSQCDVDALAFVFAWALEGDDPHPPAAGPYECE